LFGVCCCCFGKRLKVDFLVLVPLGFTILFALRSCRLVASKRSGSRHFRRAQQPYESLHVRGRASHEFLGQYFPTATVTGAAAAMTVHHVPQLALFEVALFCLLAFGLVLHKKRVQPMTRSLNSLRSQEGLAMIIVMESARSLKAFVSRTSLSELARSMVLRMVVTFILHRGRMSCSQAAGAVASETIHRGQLTRFLARPRWQKADFNAPLRAALLEWEAGRGTFVFIIDATLVGQAGKKTQNTYSTGYRPRNPKKGRRYGKNKHASRSCHSFTFGLLMTPGGYRIPFQIPHYTKEYCQQKGLAHRTTADSAAALIRSLPLPEEAEVIVLGDTAYDALVVREACDERGYRWIFPANPERVYEGPTGQRPQLRSRLKDWAHLSLATIRLRASVGKYAKYRRLSKWRVGPKQKPRVYYAYL
jgi:hypothetical protein